MEICGYNQAFIVTTFDHYMVRKYTICDLIAIFARIFNVALPLVTLMPQVVQVENSSEKMQILNSDLALYLVVDSK